MKRSVIYMEKVYVKVTTDFDSTGYMQPRYITWNDGRVFKIETVKDFRPAGSDHESLTADCYTVMISGSTKYLYFEKANRLHKSCLGRWYVKCPRLS